MAGGVHQVEAVGAAVGGAEVDGNRLAFDGDAPFLLDVHGIEHLVVEVPVAHQVGLLEEAVGEGGLAVVDVRNDAEVAGEGGG